MKALLRVEAKKEEALKKVNADIALFEKAPVATKFTHTEKSTTRALCMADYAVCCEVRDMLEGKVSTEAAPEETDANEKEEQKGKGIPEKLRTKARKKLSSMGIEMKDYTAKLKEVITCKTPEDKKLAKTLILAGADVQTRGGYYMKKAAAHPDVLKLLRIAGAEKASPKKAKHPQK